MREPFIGPRREYAEDEFAISHFCLKLKPGYAQFPPRCSLDLGHEPKTHSAWLGPDSNLDSAYTTWEDEDGD